MGRVTIQPRTHTNRDNDGFVGIRFKGESIRNSDNNEGTIEAIFPLGYNYATVENEDDLKKQIYELLAMIKSYNKVNGLSDLYGTSNYRDEFPFDAYMTIIRLFIESGYYTENETRYKSDTRGKINWKRTIKNIKPIVQEDGDFIYIKFVVRENTINENEQITKIHEYCVYEAFQKLGWLFTPFMPHKPRFMINKNNKVFAISLICDALMKTYNDKYKLLFTAMLSILNYRTDKKVNSFYFGTMYFEHVWECLIDNAYGEFCKKDYFPPFQWFPNPNGLFCKGNELRPDTIMKQNGDTFVLDAKYYAFCVDKKYLPSGSDINKQIVYGKYAYDKARKNGKNGEVYSAFLIPYNFESNPYNLEKIDYPYCYIGYATGWEQLSSEGKYSRVVAILVDTKYLLSGCCGLSKAKLAEIISKR
jgi:hypothetical protein